MGFFLPWEIRVAISEESQLRQSRATVAVFLCDQTTGCEAYTLLRQMDMGSLTSAQTWVHAVHTKGGQAQTNLHKSWLCGIQKLPLTLPCQGIEPRVFGFEFRRTNHWATSPRSQRNRIVFPS